MAKRKTTYKPRIQKEIQNISRAVNKIDESLINSTVGMSRDIESVKTGINTVSYTVDGIEKTVRYDQIQSLSRSEQGALGRKLTVDRYNLRQERALKQLQEKGKISWQFKRSLEQDNPDLLQNINELAETLAGSQTEAIKDEFSKQEIITGEDWFNEADTYFQSGGATPQLNDFYQPGTAGGFSHLNIFTWNAYKVLRGI